MVRGGGPRNPGRNGGAGGFWRAHQSVLLAVVVAGADADAEDGAGEGFQVAVGCGGQVAGAVTGVDAGDEHGEYGGYRGGKERGDNEQDGGGGHWPAPFRSSDRPWCVTGQSLSEGPGNLVTVTVGRGKGETNNTVLLTVR